MKGTIKVRRPLAEMTKLANSVVNRLAPACERIAIAGSIRRQKAMIGDIEIVAIAKKRAPVFGEPQLWPTEIDKLLAECKVDLIKNGRKYKQFTFNRNGHEYQVDLFLQSTDTWGMNYVIRTGSAEFTRKLVTQKSKGGYLPDDLRVKDARIWRGDTALDTPEESDVFDVLGLNFVEPRYR